MEVGGKNPVIIDENVDVTKAAKRICWGRNKNAGLSQVAPDYVLIHENIAQEFFTQYEIHLNQL